MLGFFRLQGHVSLGLGRVLEAPGSTFRLLMEIPELYTPPSPISCVS